MSEFNEKNPTTHLFTICERAHYKTRPVSIEVSSPETPLTQMLVDSIIQTLKDSSLVGGCDINIRVRVLV